MQLKWFDNGAGYFETRVFNNIYAVMRSMPWSPFEEWKIVRLDPLPSESLKEGFETKGEAMVAAHRIIEKELEKGYIGKADIVNRFKAKLSYIPEDMFGCKKALALFTNENGDEYIDGVLISATIPKGSLVREVDPEHHDGLPASLGICRKCRSDKAIIVDILDPMCVRPGETTNLPSRKAQRKKIPIISVHVVSEAIRTYFIAQKRFYGYMSRSMQAYRDECTIMLKLIEKFMSIILNPNIDACSFGKLLSKIIDLRSNSVGESISLSIELAIAAKVLEPYMDIITRYKDDSYMCCKVLLARILRDIGIMDIALKHSYKIGSKIQIDDFNLSNNSCGAGFHFFKTAIEAHIYKFN